MKRISVALSLMLLSTTAHANGYSFAIGGHFIHIDASRHCRSLSCVSWSDSGTRRSHRDVDEAAAPAKPVATAPACPPVAAPAAATPAAPETAAPRTAPAPVAPPVPVLPPAPVRAQVAPPVVAPAPPVPVQPVRAPAAPVVQAQAAPPTPASKPADTVASVAPPKPQAPSTIELAAANAQAAPKPEVVIGKPREKATVEATVTERPVATPEWAKDWSPPAKGAAAPKPVELAAHEDWSPLGDWQTEGKKGLVRIEKCGAALCGYLLNETTNTTGETVLSNMKAKTDAQWAGDIYSRASGNSYYAKMTFKQPDTLRVEACAIGRFFCSGNDWTRVPKSDEVVTSREQPPAPKS
jgi:uncharacterized protein (DUF2147 family)